MESGVRLRQDWCQKKYHWDVAPLFFLAAFIDSVTMKRVRYPCPVGWTERGRVFEKFRHTGLRLPVLVVRGSNPTAKHLLIRPGSRLHELMHARCQWLFRLQYNTEVAGWAGLAYIVEAQGQFHASTCTRWFSVKRQLQDWTDGPASVLTMRLLSDFLLPLQIVL